MKLAVFVSDYRLAVDTLDRLKPEKMGIILVGNGVYHATVKEKGSTSSVMNCDAEYYVLKEDLDTRGLGDANMDDKVNIVNYGGVVDLIFNEYDKTAWL